MDERERRIRTRLRDDLPYYASKCLTIRTKEGAMRHLVLNRAQTYLHKAIEEQKARTGKVRVLIPKSRQTGTTTYTQARFFHAITHRKGLRAFILTHHSDATSNIFDMTARLYDHLPELVKPSRDVSNARELLFGKLSSGYRVGTAGSKAVGRSQTIQLCHGSEVSYWDNAEEHWASLLEAVPNAPGTEIILESTSSGRSGKFYEACVQAQAGESDYEVVFLPWIWMPEYAELAPSNFARTKVEENLSDHVAALYHETLSNDQLYWRRKKLYTLGASRFQREYPIDIEECFAADAEGALWERTVIHEHRRRPDQLPPLRQIAVGLDPATTAKVTSDETGIIVVGLGQDDHLYVFADHSGKYHPKEWAGTAVQACRRGWNGRPGDYIVAETNQGGEMVEETVRGVDRNIGYKGVHEHDGKRVRADPVALYYRQGLVHHVGTGLESLEDEMCTWAARTNDESPNRVDALVLACKTLKPYQSSTGILDYYQQLATKEKEKVK